MLEIIGFLVWIVVTVGLTAFPFLLLGLSGLGGGPSKADKAGCLIVGVLAAYSWYHIFTQIEVTIL